MAVESQRVEDFRLTSEPFYLPIHDEVALFETAYKPRLPVLLKGPTGCGKTAFSSTCLAPDGPAWGHRGLP